jgi:hypothetical protein
MDSNAILREGPQLCNVKGRPNSLTDQHTFVSEALISISGRFAGRPQVGSSRVDQDNAALLSDSSKRPVCTFQRSSLGSRLVVKDDI